MRSFFLLNHKGNKVKDLKNYSGNFYNLSQLAFELIVSTSCDLTHYIHICLYTSVTVVVFSQKSPKARPLKHSLTEITP